MLLVNLFKQPRKQSNACIPPSAGVAWCALQGYLTMVQLLLKHGADCTASGLPLACAMPRPATLPGSSGLCEDRVRTQVPHPTFCSKALAKCYHAHMLISVSRVRT